ncbi:MAG TPA: aminotransferase class I/II-fold pyridoxal phosphate-dependent enzyme [Polyangia bacterium]
MSNKPRQLPPKTSLATRAVHAGEAAHKAHDAITTPIVSTATYVFADTASLRDHFEGRIEREEYGRYGNPTVRIAERKIAALDEAEDAVVFSSGMAAATTTLLALLKAGDHVVMTSDCYRRTRQFILTFLSRYGITSTLVEPGDLAALEAALIPGKTKVILSETPTNPYLRVLDLPRLAEIKRRFGSAKLVIDATFATPVNLRPLALGADLVIHSGTKYLGGHNDLMAGVVCGNEGLVSVIRDLRGVLGAVLDAHSAYLLLRGIKTLSLRVGRQNESALRIARWLEEQPQIERVFYPGLASHPDHAIARAQMAGFGGVVSFFFKGDLDATSRFIDACRIAQIAPSLGGVETLIEQPALMSFYELDTAQREAIGIRNNLVRMAVGVEDADDLIADLAQALAVAGKTR